MKSLRLLFKRHSSPAKTSSSSSKFKNPKPPVSNGADSSKQSSSQDPLKTHFASLIKSSETTLQLRHIQAQILRRRLSSSANLTTLLISAYSSLKSTSYALSVFNNSHHKSLFLFNALIRGLTENSRFQSSISHFLLMLRHRVRPDKLTYPFVIKSVAGEGLRCLGLILHGRIIKSGVEFDTFVRVSLVEMFVKLEEMCFALQVFDESPERNKGESILLWNVLINGFCKVGNLGKAMELFEAMPEKNIGSWNSLINGLMRNGDLNKATQLFDEMKEKDVVSWTTIVNGLSQNGDHQKALSMFFKMLEVGLRPNDLTLVSALSACAKIGALKAGVSIHRYIVENGFQFNQAIATALVDMYSKCGNIQSADKVFEETKEKDIRTWSVMIWGWAIHGFYGQVIQCFKNMIFSGIKPDAVVFLALLTACSHTGLVDLGLNFFASMRLDYSIEPTMKHYTLVVDLLGRAGRLDEAMKFIERMPIGPDFVTWGALFCACRAHKNIKMSELVSQKLLQLEPKHPGSYVFMSNVYAAVGRWEDAERTRTAMQSRAVGKDPGWSSIEVDGQVHSFVAGDHSHKHTREIYLKLEEIVAGAREQGYMPETGWVLHNIEEEEKEDALGSHSEKLALTFALLHTSSGTTIRIVKNLRVCGDCHSLMKYVSKMSQREIVLRDIKRFHHFKDGACSCGDYW
ncbi:pentatricopeptide repeat-containing protein At1g04840-like [Hibiscus syriacus]|uniref:pentatricopeptide repeat-containing protein At1g04840-like n=1 Tax=Hibiscus syriacus TaxID=106335 RepID=UPI0019226C4B|nr:pentatricopeptide repeat-containing protein At1g04840-like [Hibiscus syriacus]